MSKECTTQFEFDINDPVQFYETLINHITVIKGFTQLLVTGEAADCILNEINTLNELIKGYLLSVLS